MQQIHMQWRAYLPVSPIASPQMEKEKPRHVIYRGYHFYESQGIPCLECYGLFWLLQADNVDRFLQLQVVLRVTHDFAQALLQLCTSSHVYLACRRQLV